MTFNLLTMGVDLNAFHKLTYGLYLITSVKGEAKNGMTATAAFQVTSEPARIAVAINKGNLTHDFVEASGLIGISVLEKETPFPYIGRFGFQSGRDTDKFAGIQYDTGETGVPLPTEHTIAVFELKVRDSLDVGTHTLFIGDLIASRKLSDAEPMTYSYYHVIKGGKSPKRAPTYIAEGGE